MQPIRLFLYAAIGALSLSLWSAWQHDYAPSVPAASVSTAESAKTTEATPLFSAAAPNAPATSSAPKAIINSTSSSEHRLINVRTDVLDLAIDPVGGNIVSAKLIDYPASLQDKNVPQTILSDSPDHFYVAQSGLIFPGGPDSTTHQAEYVTTQQSYALLPGEDTLPVELVWHNRGVTVKKEFVFKRGSYAIDVNYQVANQNNNALNGTLFTQIAHKNILSEQRSFFHFSTFTGAAISSAEKPYEKLSYVALGKQDLVRDINGGWLAVQQRYFLSAWIPNQNSLNHYFSHVSGSGIYTIGMFNEASVPANARATFSNTFYVGPEIAANLKPLANHLDLTIDYGWLWFISLAIFWLMQQIHKVVGNWGWSIILVTLFIKLVFYKLSEKSYRSMAHMRELTPRLKVLQERFKDDKQKLSQATMELYRKEKVNPLGGCLPIVLQIPVFIALYYVLSEAVELRHAPFMFWIHDLAVSDPYFILPILMGISMFFQQRLSPQPADPMQAKMMMFMPIMFTVFFISFPAGLVLYWLVNNLLSILQQWYITEYGMKK